MKCPQTSVQTFVQTICADICAGGATAAPRLLPAEPVYVGREPESTLHAGTRTDAAAVHDTHYLLRKPVLSGVQPEPLTEEAGNAQPSVSLTSAGRRYGQGRDGRHRSTRHGTPSGESMNFRVRTLHSPHWFDKWVLTIVHSGLSTRLGCRNAIAF